MNSYLRWAGSKKWALEHIKALYDPNRRFVDPFCGGLSLPLGLKVKKALLSDINPHLISCHEWVKSGALRTGTVRYENDKDIYYKQRTRFNEIKDSSGPIDVVEKAELFYYLNRSCFNGLCRFNNKGNFNVPFGDIKSLRCINDFSSYSVQMQDWEFKCGDFQTVTLEPNDFVLADPPFDNAFTKYAKEDFTWSDQVILAYWLAEHPGPVVAHNHKTDRIIDLYSGFGFEIIEVKAPRRISCTGDRTPATEVIMTKNIEDPRGKIRL